jgi:N-acetylglucosamine-6-sulfatase
VNVLLIVADDMRADLLPFMPFTNGVLRRAGTQFTGMRCSVPLCTPARGAIASGVYAKEASNGLYQNSGTDIANVTTHSLPVWLQTAGVTTGMFGKYTYPGVTSPPGGAAAWDTWRVSPTNTQEPYTYTVWNEAGVDVTPSAPKPHQTNYFYEQVGTFIETATQPWFCQYSPTSPHVNAASLNNPLPESMTRYGWLRWPFDLLTDASTKPSWIQAAANYTAAAQSEFRAAIRAQARECRDLDGVIEQLYADLVAAGRINDTIIMFASDSGVFYGEQRLGGVAYGAIPTIKDHPYDCVMKAPCIIAGTEFTAGAVVDEPCILQDLTATIVAILGATATVTLDGVDLRDPITRTGILYEREGSGLNVPDAQGIVTSTRKLVRYVDATGTPPINLTATPTDEFEMYDLDTDPTELVNVANVGGRLTERNALEAQLDALLA